MQLSAIFRAFRYIVVIFLCLTLVFAAPASSSLSCLGQNDPGLLLHPIRHHYNDNDTSSVTMVVATKAHLSPVVFRGTLLSVLVQRDGTVRATFSVDQTMKMNAGDGRTLSLDAGQLEVVYLKKPKTDEPCVFEVNEENLKLGTSYVIFGRPTNNVLSSVTATSFPIPYEKITFRAIKKIVCKGCAKAPKVEGLKNVRIAERSKLRLQCHLSGNPIPWVTWYKDGQIIDGKGRVKVRTKRRTSRLIIRQSRLRDRGVYECRAVNIAQPTPVSAKAIVTITRKKTTKIPRTIPTTTTTASSLWPIASCPNSDFCLNGGTCVFYKDVREYVCHCAEGFVGHRCDFKDVMASLGGVKSLWGLQNLLIVIVILFILFFCCNLGCLFVCWKHRNKSIVWNKFRKMAPFLKEVSDVREIESIDYRVNVNSSVTKPDVSSVAEDAFFLGRDSLSTKGDAFFAEGDTLSAETDDNISAKEYVVSTNGESLSVERDDLSLKKVAPSVMRDSLPTVEGNPLLFVKSDHLSLDRDTFSAERDALPIERNMLLSVKKDTDLVERDVFSATQDVHSTEEDLTT